MLLVLALAGLLVAVVSYPPSGFELALQRFLASIPRWLDPVWAFLTDLPWLLAIVLVVVAVVRLRVVIVAQAVLSLLLAGALGLCAARLALGSWPEVSATVFGTASAPRFPERAARRGGRGDHRRLPAPRPAVAQARPLGLVVGVLGAAIVGGGTPMGTLAALLVGAAAAALARLPGERRRAGPESATSRRRWHSSASPPRTSRSPSGRSRRLPRAGVDAAGRPLLVKVYGRDAHDTQLVATLWRNVWYRGRGVPLRLGRLQAVEHEAFVTLLAAAPGSPPRRS